MPTALWTRSLAALTLVTLPLTATSASRARAADLPFIADDLPRAVALAKERHQPIFIEAWAPW